jgi:hypothetical protein
VGEEQASGIYFLERMVQIRFLVLLLQLAAAVEGHIERSGALAVPAGVVLEILQTRVEQEHQIKDTRAVLLLVEQRAAAAAGVAVLVPLDKLRLLALNRVLVALVYLQILPDLL